MLLVVAAATWGGTFAWMVDRWGEEGGYYLHGFLVPPAAAWLAWRRRREAGWGERGALWPGLTVVAAGALLQVPAAVLEVHFVSAIAFLVALTGLVVAGGGVRALRAWAGPLALLVFMVPMPLQAVAHLNLALKLAAASAAVEAAQTLGIVVVRDGAAIVLEGGESLVVGTVCSGLRFLVSLTALGAFVALASSLPALRRWALFAASIPIAFLANVLRILALLVLADRSGVAATEGTPHDISGVLLFAVALGALLGLESLLRPRRAVVPR